MAKKWYDMSHISDEERLKYVELLNAKKSPFHESYTQATQDDAIARLHTKEMLRRVWWTGDFFQDYWCTLRKSHSVLALFLSHPLSSVDSKERIVLTLTSIFLSIWGLWVADYDCSDSSTSYSSSSSSACQTSWEFTFVWGLFVAIYMQFMYQFAACGCIATWGDGMAKGTIEMLGHVAMCMCCFTPMVMAIYALTFNVVFMNWLSIQLTSWCYGLVIPIFYFSYKWCKGDVRSKNQKRVAGTLVSNENQTNSHGPGKQLSIADPSSPPSAEV